MSGVVDGTVAVLLPDDWAVLDLDDDTARTACVEDLVQRRLGGVPDLAPLQAAMRQELLRSTERAARAGGVLMALAVGTGGAPPVPASLTVYRVPGSLDARGRAAMTSVLASDEPGHTLDLGEGPAGTVLRRVRPTGASSGLTGDSEVPALVADYWVEPTPGAQLVHLVFSSPLVDLRDELLGLFDTVVSSVRVLQPATPRTPQEDM
ncbi:hypothetical protein [Cellulomonas xiejunii]|uniref:Uncharacterized protein n=1 Tax=Cellulomonas xiejunii TaxID=2968083 RepID=A0ABY5KQX3_9CELL|nr:hypothetical protein [Cellulomonas xiejunii]MCC2314207.1 hypothetical protein [Cellulomonas xiejunii]MCC2319569.1 hypothetical protein [Cellulomonas xiejunii]UUI71485.1 hypothetical protein NP048_17095 [Cellulomonas xiejunii]